MAIADSIVAGTLFHSEVSFRKNLKNSNANTATSTTASDMRTNTLSVSMRTERLKYLVLLPLFKCLLYSHSAADEKAIAGMEGIKPLA